MAAAFPSGGDRTGEAELLEEGGTQHSGPVDEVRAFFSESSPELMTLDGVFDLERDCSEKTVGGTLKFDDCAEVDLMFVRGDPASSPGMRLPLVAFSLSMLKALPRQSPR